MDPTTTRLAERAVCPRCAAPNNSVTGPGSVEPGDISICWHCRALGIFLTDGKVRLPTEDEEKALMADPLIVVALVSVGCGGTPTEAMSLLPQEPRKKNE